MSTHLSLSSSRFRAGHLRMIAALAAGLLAAACGDSKSPDVKAAFASHLGETWKVQGVKITVKEDVGSKVEPVMRHRFEANVAPTADMYTSLARLDDVSVVERTMRKGKAVKVYAVSTSQYSAGSWDSMFNVENDVLYDAGRPMEIGPKAVVKGSREYKKLIEDIKAERASFETREKAANEQSMELSQALTAARQAQQEKRQQLAAAFQDEQRASRERQNEAMRENNVQLNAIRDRYNGLRRGQTADVQRRLREQENEERQAVQKAYQDAVAAERQVIQAAQSAYQQANSAQDPDVQRITNEITKLNQRRQEAMRRAQNIDNFLLQLEGFQSS